MEFRLQKSLEARSAPTALLQTNDNRSSTLSMGRSVLPKDAFARIFRTSRSVMTSHPARDEWKLVFEPRYAPFIEPLMGYTGCRDTLGQVELGFPTLGAAIRYAERQGLRYVVHSPTATHAKAPSLGNGTIRHFSDEMLDRLGLSMLSESYGCVMAEAANRNDPAGPERWTAPMDVVVDRGLSIDAKRSILMNWALTEYLIDQATNEGMPENDRPSRLYEVEQALLSLERDRCGARAANLEQQAA